MAADIVSATSSINVSAMNIGSATAGTNGQGFCVSELNHDPNYCWQIVPTGSIVSVTANLMGSIDGVSWFVLDTITQNDTRGQTNWGAWTGWSATAVGGAAAGEMRWLLQLQVNYLRIDVTTVNGGGTVTGTFSVFEANR